MSLMDTFLLIACWAVPSMALVRLNESLGSSMVVWSMVSVSILTFVAYASDKRRARAGRWRISESTLHLLEALGGWPAAFMAQRFLRHKTAKRGYQRVYWMIAIIHQYLAVDYLLHWQITLAVWRALNQLNSSG